MLWVNTLAKPFPTKTSSSSSDFFVWFIFLKWLYFILHLILYFHYLVIWNLVILLIILIAKSDNEWTLWLHLLRVLLDGSWTSWSKFASLLLRMLVFSALFHEAIPWRVLHVLGKHGNRMQFVLLIVYVLHTRVDESLQFVKMPAFAVSRRLSTARRGICAERYNL